MILLAAALAGQLVAGANEVAGGRAEPGWPVVVSAWFEPKSASARAPREVRPVLLDANDHVVPFDAVAVPPTTEASGRTQFYWIADAAASRRLAPGTYRVTLQASPADSTLWISPGRLQVLAAGTAKQGLGELRLQLALLQGRRADAMAEVDKMVAAHPASMDAWVSRGDLFMMSAMPDSALACYRRAIGNPKSPDDVPPFVLMKMRQAFWAVLEKRGALEPGEKGK